MKIEQQIYFKKENNLDRYFLIRENPNSSIFENFVSQEFVAGIRLQIIKGNKHELQKLKEELNKSNFEFGLPEYYEYTEAYGIVSYGNNCWHNQRYLQLFEQYATIIIANKEISPHIRKWFEYLNQNPEPLKRVIKRKIMDEYEGTKQGTIGLWKEEEIRDSFPKIENESDIFNLISKIQVGIYNEETFNHEAMNKEIYSIRANCPWDIEHGIELEIKLEEIEKES